MRSHVIDACNRNATSVHKRRRLSRERVLDVEVTGLGVALPTFLVVTVLGLGREVGLVRRSVQPAALRRLLRTPFASCPTSLPVRPLRRLKNTGGNGRPRRFSPPPHRHPLLTPPPLPLRKWAEETPVAGCPGSVAAVAKSCIPTTGAGAGRLKPPSGWPVEAGRARFGGRGGPAGLSNPSPGGCDHPTNRFLEIDHTVPVADRGRTEITNTWRI